MEKGAGPRFAAGCSCCPPSFTRRCIIAAVLEAPGRIGRRRRDEFLYLLVDDGREVIKTERLPGVCQRFLMEKF